MERTYKICVVTTFAKMFDWCNIWQRFSCTKAIISIFNFKDYYLRNTII